VATETGCTPGRREKRPHRELVDGYRKGKKEETDEGCVDFRRARLDFSGRAALYMSVPDRLMMKWEGKRKKGGVSVRPYHRNGG